MSGIGFVVFPAGGRRSSAGLQVAIGQRPVVRQEVGHFARRGVVKVQEARGRLASVALHGNGEEARSRDGASRDRQSLEVREGKEQFLASIIADPHCFGRCTRQRQHAGTIHHPDRSALDGAISRIGHRDRNPPSPDSASIPVQRVLPLHGRARDCKEKEQTHPRDAAASQAHDLPEPAGDVRDDPRPVVEHRGQLRDEHELAELRRRVDAQLPDADARARGAELRVRRLRHGDPRGAHPRPGPQAGQRHRQLLGRPHPHDPLHPPAALLRLRAVPRQPGRRADVQRVPLGVAPAGHQGRGRQEHRRSAHRRRAGGLADRDQGPRDERGRLLQRELGASVREPDAALELRHPPVDPRDTRRRSRTRSARW